MFIKPFNVEPKIFVDSRIIFGTERRGPQRILLGKFAEKGVVDSAWFDISREHVVAIVGKRGSGKSHTLGVIAESFALDSSKIVEGVKNRGAILLDTLGIYWTTKFKPNTEMKHPAIHKQFQELQEWNLDTDSNPNVEVYVPAGFEITGLPEGVKEFTINVSDLEPNDWGFLLAIDTFRDVMGQLLSLAYTKVTAEGWDDASTSIHISAKHSYSIHDLIQCIQRDRELTSPDLGFDIRTRRALISRLESIMQYSLFSTDGTPLKELLKVGKLSILLLQTLPDDIRSVVSSILFRTILGVRRVQSMIEKRRALGQEVKEEVEVPPVWIMIDEAQNISPSEASLISGVSLVKLVREGRNFGISLALTTQQPTAIDQRIMAQVDTLIIHKLSVKKDIDAVASNSKTSQPSSVYYQNAKLEFDDLIRKLPTGDALISNTDTVREFIIQVRPRVTVHGGFEA